MLYTISGLKENVRGVTIRVRVLSKNPHRTVKTKDGLQHRVVDVEVGDRTGRIFLSLWDDKGDLVDAGDIIDIENAYVKRFKGRLSLSIGKYGKLEKVEDSSFPNFDNLE